MLRKIPRPVFLPLLFFTLLLVIAFYDIVFLGKTFKVTTANSQALPTGAYGQENNKPAFIPINGTDTPVMEEPMYEFIKKNLWHGIVPLWNPHQACGFPIIAMIEIGMFFPLNAIMYLLPSLYSWDLLILSRLLLAALLTYWFMRSMGFSKIPSYAAAITFMLSGPMVLWQYWTANVDILLPLLLIALDRLIKKARIQDISFLASAVALTFLAGHPEHIFLVNFYAFTFFIFRLMALRKRIKIKKVLLYYCAAQCLGLSLSAIVLFPFLRNFTSEFWNAHPQGVGTLLEEEKNRALTLALPHFFQKVPLTFQWQYAGWLGGYLGTLPIGLAFLSLFKNHKKSMNYFFAIMAFVIIGKQYNLTVINWIGYLPLLNKCRFAWHTIALAAFTVAVLTGMGVRSVLCSKKSFLKGCIYASMLFVIILGHLLFLKGDPIFNTALKATYFACGVLFIFLLILIINDKYIIQKKWIGIILCLALFSELFLYIHRGWVKRFDSFPKVPYMEYLKSSPSRVRSYGNFWAFYPNTASAFQVDDLGFFFGLAPKRFVTFVNTLLIRDHFRNNLRPPALRAIPVEDREHLLDMLNVKYIITPNVNTYANFFKGKFRDPGQKLSLTYNNEVKIYERPHSFPRTYIVHRAIFETDEQKALWLVNSIGSQLNDVAVIQNQPIRPIYNLLKDAPVTDNSNARITHYTANEVMINAVMENPGFLILGDGYHPDWRVFVNDKESTVFQTNYLIRSVFLPKGIYKVRFVFDPKSFYRGVWVSLSSMLFILALWLIPKFYPHLFNH